MVLNCNVLKTLRLLNNIGILLVELFLILNVKARGRTIYRKRLLRVVWDSDERCQKVVYETLYQTMYAICLRYSNNSDEAKDLLQDGFMKLFKKIKKYKGDANFTVWVKRLFINHSIDYVRSAYKKYVYLRG